MAISSWGQKEEIIHHHKFPNGKTSTISVIKDNREGYAKAYNFKGEEIYSRSIRRYAGHASVTFHHYPSGMVKKAEYSSHPDGGIQWYRTYTHFDENGNITSEIEDNWDTRVTVPTHYIQDTTRTKPQTPNPVEPPKPVVPGPDIIHEPIHNPQLMKPEIVQCAAIHQNRTEFVNHSKHKIFLSVSHAGKDTIIVLKPGKTFVGPTYISAEIASPMNNNVRFQFSCKKKNCALDKTSNSTALAQYETMHTVNFYGKRKIKKKK